jgi:hypothetical protein
MRPLIWLVLAAESARFVVAESVLNVVIASEMEALLVFIRTLQKG